MDRQQAAAKLERLIEEGNLAAVGEALAEMHSHEVADLLASLDRDEAVTVLRSLSPSTAAEVLLDMDPELRHEVLEELDPDTAVRLISELDSDDAADIVSELPERVRSEVMARMSPEELIEVKSLLQYPEDTAGGIMQTELVQVTPDMTVRDTIEWIRLIADEIDEFYEIYVTDSDDRLLGQVPLTKLILANPSTKISEIMEPVEITVTPDVDQEKVADIVKRHDIVVLPVVDEKGVLLGRITSDDVMDVITEEASEDMYQMAGIGEYIHPLFTPTFERLKARTPWIILTLLGELVIALIIARFFETTLQQAALLAAFMPAIMATGGNVGVQVSSIIVRGLGMGTIGLEQTFKVVVEELKLALLLGSIAGIIAAAIALLITHADPAATKIALAIFVAMICAPVATTLMGVFVPLTLYKLRFDPAVASSPFISMSNDLFGSVVYFLIAMVLLRGG